MGTISFNVLPPPLALERDIECIRTAVHTGTDKGLEVKVCPNGLPGLVFGLSAEGGAAIESITVGSSVVTDLPIVFLHGQGASPSLMRFKQGPYVTIQVVLKPHALYSIFGLDAEAINTGYLTPDVLGVAQLTEQLIHAKSDALRITLLCSFLETKLASSTSRDELIENALALIESHVDTVSVKELFESLHISERQFQKRFMRVVGMPAQLYIRVKRVNEALRLMDTGNYEQLSDVAQALNFYDQSHFIREMKTFSWVTPKDITQKVSEFHQDLGGASYL